MKKYLFPTLAAIAVFIVGIILSERYDIYKTFPHFDIFMHLVGGAVIGWFMFIFLRKELRGAPTLTQVFIVASAACFVGIIWEFAEYISSLYARGNFPLLYHYFHGGEINDTIKDIADDMIGGIVAATVLIWRNRP